MDYSVIFQNFTNWIEINFYFSILLFFLFIFVYSVFSFPGLILFISFAGYSFGIILSYIICLISVTLGSFCFFIISKYFFRKFFHKKFKKYTSKIDYLIKNSSFEYLVIFRIIPGTPLMLQNFLLSTLDISNYKFIFSTLIGVSPIMLFSIFIGNKINNLMDLNNVKTSDIFTLDLFLILFLIIVIILIRIYFKTKKIN